MPPPTWTRMKVAEPDFCIEKPESGASAKFGETFLHFVEDLVS